jgi:hypothetical protein
MMQPLPTAAPLFRRSVCRQMLRSRMNAFRALFVDKHMNNAGKLRRLPSFVKAMKIACKGTRLGAFGVTRKSEAMMIAAEEEEFCSLSSVEATAHVARYIIGRSMEAEAEGRSMIQELDDALVAVTTQPMFARV